MLHKDRVSFIMPRDKELQFPAVAALQVYVNQYQQRMKTQYPGADRLTYELIYEIHMPQEDWEMFKLAGLQLNQEPVQILGGWASGRITTQEGSSVTLVDAKTHSFLPDVVIDMSDDRINLHRNSGKHAFSICSLLSGVVGSPLPNLTRIKPRISDFIWLPTVFPDLRLLKDGEITGVCGKADRVTYLIASFGLAVIEIVPVGRHRNWLSKWLNPYYRAIADDGENNGYNISQARLSIEKALTETK